jgi:tRNA U34 5-carboxymethylaminomethyl modifying GTPase MnmE/TrmE
MYVGGVYLLGGTNTGKSSLFNSLIDSDLCHIHTLDCIQCTTVSNLSDKISVMYFLIFIAS